MDRSRCGLVWCWCTLLSLPDLGPQSEHLCDLAVLTLRAGLTCFVGHVNWLYNFITLTSGLRLHILLHVDVADLILVGELVDVWRGLIDVRADHVADLIQLVVDLLQAALIRGHLVDLVDVDHVYLFLLFLLCLSYLPQLLVFIP